MRVELIQKISWKDSRPSKCNSLFRFAIQTDSFISFNWVLCKGNEHARWTLQLHLAGFSFCLLLLLTRASLFQRMYVTSSARLQSITTFPLTGTVSSSGYTLAMKGTRTSATQSSPNFCRYVFLSWRFMSKLMCSVLKE